MFLPFWAITTEMARAPLYHLLGVKSHTLFVICLRLGHTLSTIYQYTSPPPPPRTNQHTPKRRHQKMHSPVSLTFNITAREALSLVMGLTGYSEIIRNATIQAPLNVAELALSMVELGALLNNNKNSKSCSGYLFCISWQTLWYIFLGILVLSLCASLHRDEDCEKNVLEKRRAKEKKLTKEGAYDGATYLPVTVSVITVSLFLPFFLFLADCSLSRPSKVANTTIHTRPL